MGEEEENPNPMYILPELLEEILIRLPLKSILRCRAVSKQWSSILESRRFAEKRMSLQKKKRRILAAFNCDCGGRPRLLRPSRFKGDEEIVYLHCDAARPSISCDGLVCFLERDWIIVLNPSTRQLRRFPSGLNPHPKCRFGFGLWSRFSPGNWAMGFGRDTVTGMYKVVRMCFSFLEIGLGQQEPVVKCSVLDVQTGEWRNLSPPPHVVNAGSKSVCVKGSIYWAHIDRVCRIVALDLNKEEFRDIPIPGPAMGVNHYPDLANLEDHLVFAKTKMSPEWILEMWSMDTDIGQWSKTFSIRLKHKIATWPRQIRWFTPLAVSKQGNLVFYDNYDNKKNKLFKNYPVTDEIRCLSLDTCVISIYLENLVTLPLKPTHPHPHPHPHPDPDSVSSEIRCRLCPTPWISKALQRNEFRILDIMFASLVVAGYICSPRL